jgi:hypothetical protein
MRRPACSCYAPSCLITWHEHCAGCGPGADCSRKMLGSVVAGGRGSDFICSCSCRSLFQLWFQLGSMCTHQRPLAATFQRDMTGCRQQFQRCVVSGRGASLYSQSCSRLVDCTVSLAACWHCCEWWAAPNAARLAKQGVVIFVSAGAAPNAARLALQSRCVLQHCGCTQSQPAPVCCKGHGLLTGPLVFGLRRHVSHCG